MATDPLPSPDHPVWLWKTNTNPFDPNQVEKWTPYPPDTSDVIERAYRRGSNEIYVEDEYRIDFGHKLQIHIDDSSRQRPVRRESGVSENICPKELEIEENEDDRWRRERYGFPLEPAVSNNTMADTQYHGSPFVTDWLLSFTNGKLKVVFDRIFEPLIEGIRNEGEQEQEQKSRQHSKEIIDELKEIKKQTRKLRNSKRMKILQKICAKLYTKQCFLFKLVNATLRDNDRGKLTTLGPYCYLVYNHIGSRLTDYLSIRHRVLQQIHQTESRSIIVYRGDHVTREKIEEYRQAAGKKEKYFKWLPFISTSQDMAVAEKFGRNILYIIELHRYTSNDQFVSLEQNTFYKDEAEILIRPGVRFRIDRVQFDEETGRERVYIKIVPSYVSNLR